MYFLCFYFYIAFLYLVQKFKILECKYTIFYYITKNALFNHTVHNKFIWRRHPDLNWGIKVLQTSALPLGYAAVWSGKRGSNSRPSPWQGDALPLSYFRIWRFLSAAVSATCIIICITEYFVNNFFWKKFKKFFNASKSPINKLFSHYIEMKK